MSRSGYSELDNWDLIRWRGQVASSIRGARGQKFLRDLLAALDAMPEKRLIAGELQSGDGEVCAIGALGVARGIDMGNLDESEPEDVAAAFHIAHQLAQEVVYVNDEHFDCRYIGNKRVEITPEERWAGMRAWVEKHIVPDAAEPVA